MKEAAERQLNCHNQFFETFLAIGFIGYLFLAAYFITGLYLGYKRKSFLYFVFTLICGAHFMVESMLETQAGVVFFAFFNSLFFTQLNYNSAHENT